METVKKTVHPLSDVLKTLRVLAAKTELTDDFVFRLLHLEKFVGAGFDQKEQKYFYIDKTLPFTIDSLEKEREKAKEREKELIIDSNHQRQGFINADAENRLLKKLIVKSYKDIREHSEPGERFTQTMIYKDTAINIIAENMRSALNNKPKENPSPPPNDQKYGTYEAINGGIANDLLKEKRLLKEENQKLSNILEQISNAIRLI